MRKIIYIDKDAFYASVEQYDHPELRGIPIAVGGGRSPSAGCCVYPMCQGREPLRRALSRPCDRWDGAPATSAVELW